MVYMRRNRQEVMARKNVYGKWRSKMCLEKNSIRGVVEGEGTAEGYAACVTRECLGILFIKGPNER